MKHTCKRIVSWMLVLCMVLSFVPAASAASVRWEKTDQKIIAPVADRRVQKNGAAEREDSELVRASIVLDAPSTVEAGYSTMGIASNAAAMDYRAELQAAQKRMEKTISQKALNGRPLDVVWNMTLVGNIISAWVPYGSLETIAAIDGVKTVAMEAQYEPCEAERMEHVTPNAYPSSNMIGSGTLWSSGYTGAGTRIAIVDTGTDTDHQSFDTGAYLRALLENAEAKGMSLDAYMDSLDLLTVEKIAAVLPDMNLSSMNPDVKAEDLYLNEKLAFGYNYVDNTLNIDHDDDQQGEHGSHVAGISTANRLIPRSSGYLDARDSVMMLGVAPDAQLITMKVFGQASPYDSDYMAAIEDAIVLGCDVVNLSMGTTMPGSPYTDVYSDLMEMMTETDTVVVISAGNASNWAAASMFGYLYNDDVSFDTVGAPGSYASAFTVASVENDGTVGFFFEVGEQKAFYVETLGYGNTAFATLDNSLNLDGTEYEYVFLDGLGYEEEYAGIDVTGKVVFVQRGTLNFAVKANNALKQGAAAVVVYNNQSGVSNMDLTGLSYAAPVVSITQDEGAAIRAASQDKGTHLTGKLTVYGKMGVGMNDAKYHTMSDFSSWGVPASLTLKPEITAPGGMIYSLWGSNAVTGGGSDKYETMSGTSMAAPQITGMVALMAQYYQENGMADRSGISARHLAQSLLMSTAQPLFEEASGGNYYSLMHQGAGLARVDLAANADSFIQVEGQEDYKVKAELGDDPQRTGVYAFDFTITNMTDSAKEYALNADLFRQDVFEYMENSDVWLLDTWTTGLDAKVSFYSENLENEEDILRDLNGDGVTDAADADYLLEYVVGNAAELKDDGDLSGDGQINSYDAHLLLAALGSDVVSVPANSTVSVRVRMELTEKAKAELNAENPKGAYVQAFVYARGVADPEGNSGTTHSIPVLAYYGDWSEPSMFDRGTLIEHIYMAVNTAPYLYRFIGPYGNALGIDYGDGNEFYYGGNPIIDDAAYLPERNAFSSTNGSIMTEQGYSLIRGAGDARVQITNADTGEVYFEKRLGELYPTYYNPSSGNWENTIQYAKLNWKGTDGSGEPLAEGTRVNISLTAVPHYYRRADGSYPFEGLGSGSTLTTSLTIDNTAPEMIAMDDSQIESDLLTVTAKDNEYVAAIALMNAAGTNTYSVATPNQTEKNVNATAQLDLSDVYGSKFLIAVYDYALNVSTYEVTIELGEAPREYFTAYDSQTGCYVSMKKDATVSKIVETGLPVGIRAMEYVGGHVFSITDDNSFCVADNADLSYTQRICGLDREAQWLITYFNDMAYNPKDGKLYGQFYSQLNSEKLPYLCTIDMLSGELDVIGELPVDVNTMAIDGEGNFYSAGYQSNILYTYTLEQVTGENPSMTQVGEMGYYYSSYLSSMAWDHNEDKIYWAFPNTLLEINPETAEVTLIGYQNEILLGLYVTPTADEGMFDPVDTVSSVELSLSATRVLKDSTYTLEATVWPWNASNRTVTWTTSDPAVATVDHKGTVTGISEGKCTITATSKLDPSVSASCELEVFLLEKTLNGLVWDEEGAIWMAEFNTTELPKYTKLSAASLDNNLASATIGQDGNIYAASLNMGDLKSSLYKLDGTTFQPTLIGSSTDGYVDIAPAPGQPGNSLMAAYGGNIMQVDAETGDYYNHYYMFSYNLVALAYVGTDYDYTEWGYDTQVDWYFIIDRVGYVYLMGFLEQDGKYFYLEHDQLAPGGIYTKLNFEMDTPYFGSAYFDGEMLYYSAYKESKDNVTLMAIDVAGGSKACYEIGTFADGVWPVAGLMELNKTELDNNIDLLITNSAPTPVEPQPELKGIHEEKAEGSLHNAVAPMSATEIKDKLVYVDVTLPYDGTNADMTVTFDTTKLELVDVEGRTTAFAWKAEDGKLRLSLAEADVIAETETVARLTFKPLEEGETVVSIVTGGLGSEGCGYDERVELVVPHVCPSEQYVDVSQEQWFHAAVDYVVSEGYMNGMDSTHFGPGLTMNRAQFVTVLYRMEGEPAVDNTGIFTDVPAGQFYTNAAYWALKAGITTGATANTFKPGGKLTRTELVTFMYRYAKYKGYDTSTGDLSDYQDADQVLPYAVAPWSWAVKHGVVTGMTPDTLVPMNQTNRAQAAVIFQRFDAKFR